jgi:hypothetical protein
MAKNYFLRFVLIISLPFLGFMLSCNQLNPPETIPAYAHIDNIHLDTISGQGTNSANITDAWVYVDNNPVGVFQMPCTFPIVASSGTHQVMVFAGIMQDGVASMRAKYPFYNFYQANINLTHGQTVKIKPNVWYTSWAKFHWMEDFEGSGITLHNDTVAKNHCDTIMFQTSVGAFEGKSGEVVLCGAKKFNYEGDSDTLMNLPKDGTTPVYLEFNYKSTASFWVGMYYGSIGSQIPIVAVNPTSVWKKMYVNLQATILQYSTSTLPQPFYIYFSVTRDPSVDTVRFMLDNIKLVQ